MATKEVQISNMPRTSFGELATGNLNNILSLKFPYNINSHLVDTVITNTGTVTQSNGFALIGTGTTTASTSLMQSFDRLSYVPGVGLICRFTAIFTSPIAGTKQVVGMGSMTDGYGFGYNGLNFGAVRINNGTESWTYQSDWDNTADAETIPELSFSPQLLNIFQMDLQWLGAGQTRYFINNYYTGGFENVFTDKFTNTATTTHSRNPSMPLFGYTENGATTDDIVVQIPSMSMSLQGEAKPLQVPWGVESPEVAISSGVETVILSIRNKTTYQSIENRIKAILKSVKVATEASAAKPAVIRVYHDCDISGGSWVDVNTADSSMEYNLTGARTNGHIVNGDSVAQSGTSNINLSDIDLYLGPGQSLTLTIETNATSDTAAFASWVELQ